MDRARRQFLVQSALGILGAAVAPHLGAQQSPPSGQAAPPPGQPPAFGTAPAVGPEVSAATFADAEKLVRVEMTDKDLAQAASNWRVAMAGLYECRTGPRKVALEPELAPYSLTRCVQDGVTSGPAQDRFVRSHADPGPLSASDAEIAYSPVTKLSRWIETRKLTSERLTQIYLARLQQ
jgi:hypothetical protein